MTSFATSRSFNKLLISVDFRRIPLNSMRKHCRQAENIGKRRFGKFCGSADSQFLWRRQNHGTRWLVAMRLFSLAIFRNDVQPAVQLDAAQDLYSFGFFQRGSVREFTIFFSKTLAERTCAGQRQDVEENSLFPSPHIFLFSRSWC